MTQLWAPDRRLHLPPPLPQEFGDTGFIRGTVELGAWDRRHKLIQQFREPCRSPVKQFLQMLLLYAAGVWNGGSNIKDTGGTLRSPAITVALLTFTGALNDGTKGIVVGTGSAAVDMTDYTLGTKIAHGSGAGQLIHNAVAFDSDVAVADPLATFVAYRNFNNNSGGSITVTETGIYSTSGGWFFLLFRDIPASVVVPDGGGCYAVYTLQISE